MDSPNDQKIYKTLDASHAEIRLLILPDSYAESDSISACFHTVSLHDSPTFYALSYVWGNPTMTRPLYIDSSEVLITPNLEHILRVLLSHEKGPAAVRGKAIWIDALCIDQDNTNEKEQQIPLMGQIYRQASRVLMWLGDAEGHADWAMICLSDPDFNFAASMLKKSRRAPTADEIRLKLIMENDLENRAYWTRVWIAQEMILPRTDPLILCGRHCVTWSCYVNFLQWLPSHRGEYPEVTDLWNEIKASIPPGLGYRSSFMHRTFREAYEELGGEAMNLAATMQFTSMLGASNPRDYIYGSLGILRPEDARLVIPTYSKSVTEVFKEAFRIVWLFDSNPFTALTSLSFHHVEGSPSGLPSWAPDLSNQVLPESQNHHAGLRLRGSTRAGNATWQSPTRPTFAEDILLFEGIEFDEIEKTEIVDFNYGWSPTFEDDGTHDEMVAILKVAEALLVEGLQRHIPDDHRLSCFRNAKSYDPIWKTMSHWPEELTELPTSPLSDVSKEGGSAHESVWRSLVYSRPERVGLPVLEPIDGMSSVEKERSFLWSILMQRQVIPEAWKEATLDYSQNDEAKVKATILNRLLQAIRRRSNGKKIFLTKQGFLGVATPHVKGGDVIVFVAGMHCPFVLRPFRDGYQIKGFAYVAGLMIWERLDECLKGSGIVPEAFKNLLNDLSPETEAVVGHALEVD